jgi:hypothetical protein
MNVLYITVAAIVGMFVGVFVTTIFRKDDKDTDRLDFIEHTCGTLVFNDSRNLWGVVDVRQRTCSAPTLRAAIDKAEGLGDYA